MPPQTHSHSPRRKSSRAPASGDACGLGEPDGLLTQDQVAARLKVSVRNLVRLQNDGLIPFIPLGKKVRFYWPAVLAHLNAHVTVTKRTLTPDTNSTN